MQLVTLCFSLLFSYRSSLSCFIGLSRATFQISLLEKDDEIRKIKEDLATADTEINDKDKFFDDLMIETKKTAKEEELREAKKAEELEAAERAKEQILTMKKQAKTQLDEILTLRRKERSTGKLSTSTKRWTELMKILRRWIW